MARSRNIKPGFFQNEDLAEIHANGRLLFIGLWTLADKAGLLEYRTKKIKALLFPYESVKVEKLLEDLRHAGFIKIYTANEQKYIQIINWHRHQNPHKNEKESFLPKPINNKHLSDNREKDGTSTDKIGKAQVITPDSLNLIPDSLEREEKKKSPPPPSRKNGKTLPKDWMLPEDWRTWTETNCPLVHPESTADEFRDWAHGNSNRAVAKKADWFATWRNWCRRDNEKYAEQEKWQKRKK